MLIDHPIFTTFDQQPLNNLDILLKIDTPILTHINIYLVSRILQNYGEYKQNIQTNLVPFELF